MIDLLEVIHLINVEVEILKSYKFYNIFKKRKTKKKIKEIFDLLEKIDIFELSRDMYNILSSNEALPIDKRIEISMGFIRVNIDDVLITYMLRTNKFIVENSEYIYEVYSKNNKYAGSKDRWIESSTRLRNLFYRNIIEIICYISYGGYIKYGEDDQFICKADNRKEEQMGFEEFLSKTIDSKASRQDKS